MCPAKPTGCPFLSHDRCGWGTPTTSHDSVRLVLYGTTWSRRPFTICTLAVDTHTHTHARTSTLQLQSVAIIIIIIWNVDMEAYDESIVDRTQNNGRVLQTVQTEREIMDTLRKRQNRWIGHILRHDSLFKTTLEGQIPGKNGSDVGYQEQCSWIGYWRRSKLLLDMNN